MAILNKKASQNREHLLIKKEKSGEEPRDQFNSVSLQETLAQDYNIKSENPGIGGDSSPPNILIS